MLIKSDGNENLIGYFSSEGLGYSIKHGYHLLYNINPKTYEYNVFTPQSECILKLFTQYNKGRLLFGIGDQGNPSFEISNDLKLSMNNSDLFLNPIFIKNNDVNIIEIEIYSLNDMMN